MGCLTVILIFIALAAAMAYAIGIIVAADIIMFIVTCYYISKYDEAKKMKPSKMKCPNCGSKDVHIEHIESGYEGYAGNPYSNSRFKSFNTKVKRTRVGHCNQCGFEYGYITKKEIDESKKNAKGSAALSFAALMILVVLSAFIVKNMKSNDKPETTSTSQITAESTLYI